ncbi:MAG: hypothetical protein ACE145_21790 [Terriglobia bacterium]
MRLHEKGYSKRGLARKLHCDEHYVRLLIKLAALPEEEKQNLQAGKIGVNRALDLHLRGQLQRAAPLAPAYSPEQPPPSPAAPANVVAKVNLSAEDGATIIEGWVRDNIAMCDWIAFFRDMEPGIRGMRAREFREEAVRPGEVIRGSAPHEIIEAYRPKGPTPETAQEQMNVNILWFIRWSLRALRDPRVWVDAVVMARKKLQPPPPYW